MLNSCASIYSGGSDEVYFDSEPRGSKIYIDDSYMGITPMFFELPNETAFMVRFEKIGFVNAYIKLKEKLNTRYINAILLPDSSEIKDSAISSSNVTLDESIPDNAYTLKWLDNPRWFITNFNGNSYKYVMLLGVSESGLEIDYNGSVFEIPLVDIREIKYRDFSSGNKMLTMSFLFLLMGGTLGYLIAPAVYPVPLLPFFLFDLIAMGLGMTLLGATIGIIIGIIIGASRDEYKFDFSGMSKENKKAYIEHEILKR